MVLFPMSEMLKMCQGKGFAVGYFESWNFESLKAVIEAAEEVTSPVIIGFNGGFIKSTDIRYYASIGREVANATEIPAALLLNEAPDICSVIKGIRYGFEAVMVDTSALSFTENLSLTGKVVEIAHIAGISVEAPLGKLPTAKGGFSSSRIDEIYMTDPEESLQFCKETGIDALAVSVGMVHELYKGQAIIDFERLKSVRSLVDVPLVVHGGTGISDDDSRRLVSLGIQKFNVGTALRRAFLKAYGEVLDSLKGEPPISVTEKAMEQAKEGVRQVVKDRMRVYGSAGKAGFF